jgi:2-polyprenyl-6-methoxyphenol hydroxylase-like FAD-dependent oxidoreductase
MWGRPPGLRFGVVPVDERRSYWFATQRAPPGGEDPGMAATLDRLRADLADLAPPVQIVLRHTQTLIRTEVLDFAPLASWHRGRVVLIGDAAHATCATLSAHARRAP